MQPQQPTTASRVKSIIGGSLGNLVEWYDWYAYTAFSLYFSAALLLSVIHLGGPVWWVDMRDEGMWMAVGLIHVSVLAVQLWICSLGLGWMTYELVDMPKVQAHMMAMGWVIGATVQAAIMLIGVPALIAIVMQHLVGSS